MTPLKKLITERVDIKLNEAKKIFHRYKIERLPLVNRQGKLEGLITARTVRNFEKFPYSTKDSHGRYCVGAAVGVVNDYLDRADILKIHSSLPALL